ncbi:MAG: hypothetical protein ACOYKA_03275 [Legionellaceae bacterium]
MWFKVIEVDVPRRRIGLSMKLHEKAAPVLKPEPVAQPKAKKKLPPKTKAAVVEAVSHKKTDMPFNTAMKDALLKLQVKQ